MRDYFYELSDFVGSGLTGNESFIASFSGEDSDFTRFNHAKVRQSGHVSQRYLSVDLMDGKRHAAGTATLTGERETDEARLTELLGQLRDLIPNLPEDPHLLVNEEVQSTEQVGTNELPASADAVEQILATGEGHDLVGIFAAGEVTAGFANSYGQRNWFSTKSYNFDYSIYHHADKAVKSAYAGLEWDEAALQKKIADSAEQVKVLGQDAKTIDPGKYRVYLSPVALNDFVGMVGWGGYGLKSHRTKQTVLLKMIEEGATLDESVTISENTKDGVAPNFSDAGFIKPDAVTMIENGAFKDCLISPRSAKEYGVPTNGAAAFEAPESQDIAAGDIPQAEVLSRLDTGIWINNVWYLNYSDRPACRITGMTRFACLWVENGEVVAPLNVMRFDETIYRALGENLIGLTKEREMILDSGSYGGRATSSGRVPGALIEDFNFNL
ncbi:MAG: metallopeptidase TldD-related protein [Planctomycetota bacterium]